MAIILVYKSSIGKFEEEEVVKSWFYLQQQQHGLKLNKISWVTKVYVCALDIENLKILCDKFRRPNQLGKSNDRS